MVRLSHWVAFTAVLLVLAVTALLQQQSVAQTPAAKPAATGDKQPISRSTLLNILDQRIELKQIRDAGSMTLKEALTMVIDLIAKQNGKEFPILIDTEAFKADYPDAPDIYETKVQFPPLPRQMTVASAIRFALNMVATKEATYVVLPDHILITTYRMTSPEQKLNEKIRGVFENRPLGAVLRELSESAGATIVVDNRASDKAKTEVSAAFVNDIDLAGALRVLTEMADLKVLVLDGTIYVTTLDHANALRAEKLAQLTAQKGMAQKVDPLWPYQPQNREGSRPAEGPQNELMASPEKKLQGKVRGTFDKRPLNAVLHELSESQGATIIIDKRVGDKAKTEITATFRDDVSLLAALRILTEMADLKAVVLDGAVFVTTPATAEALRKESSPRPTEMVPGPGLPGFPGLGGFGGGLGGIIP
jgi:hypothetical protein